MSISKALMNILAAIVAVGVVGAVGLAPIAGFGGLAIARTSNAMESNLADMREGLAPGVTTINDAAGEPIAWIYDQLRYPVASDAIAQPMKDAIVAIEDRRFYEHEGVDLKGAMRAMITNVLAGGVEQGASTLNQQYVKNYLLLVDAENEAEEKAATETSIPRKLREMRMASDLDKTLSKEEILTRYLNLVPFGNGAYGIEAAARTYFNIPASELNVAQSAMLAGMVQSSSYLNPYTNPQGATERRNTVLREMAASGAISAAEAAAAQREPLGVLERPNSLPSGCITAGDRGFFCDYVLNYLESKGLTKRQVARGGYTITTTLDPDIQAKAQGAATRAVNPQQPGVTGVMNIIEPNDTREIKAMVSSRTYGLDAEQAQTVLPLTASLVGAGAGSVFKIFTAAAAIERGMALSTPLDVPARVQVTNMGEGGAKNCPPGYYCVENTGAYPPRLNLGQVLAQSPNTTFIKLIEQYGVARVVDIAVALGLRSYAAPGTFDAASGTSIADAMKASNAGSFTLGPTPVNPLELSNVGATLAAGGKWCEPTPIKTIIDQKGRPVGIERPACEQAISGWVASTLTAGLTGDTVVGTAKDAANQANWTAPMAAKTGTTESHHSAAFLGFNSTFSAAPYVYNDGPRSSPLCSAPVRQCPDGNIFGGKEPAAMWFSAASQIPLAQQGTVPKAGAIFGGGYVAAQPSTPRSTHLSRPQPKPSAPAPRREDAAAERRLDSVVPELIDRVRNSL